MGYIALLPSSLSTWDWKRRFNFNFKFQLFMLWVFDKSEYKLAMARIRNIEYVENNIKKMKTSNMLRKIGALKKASPPPSPKNKSSSSYVLISE